MKKRSVDEFDDSPTGNAKRVKLEIKAAKKRLEEFHGRAKKAVDYYLDVRGDGSKLKRINIYHSDVDVKEAQLYGQIPKVTANRRWSDANDDEARVAGEMLERMLNLDIECDSDGYRSTMRHCLKDWLTAGLGVPWLRYEVEHEHVEAQEAVTWPHPETGEPIVMAPAVEAHDIKAEEEVCVDYIYWEDFLWGRARTWGEVPWIAKRIEMDRDELIERFGEEVGNEIPLNAKARDDKRDADDPWSRAEVWEFWDKEKRCAYWVSDGMAEVLDSKPDPLELENFWPVPEPLMANLTTSDFMPEPDYGIAKDLYDGCDQLYGRICLLEEAISVVGIYDKGAVNELKDMLKPSNQNRMIPVEPWAMFAEKGGIKGVVDWFPIEMVVNCLNVLTQKLADKMTLLQQVTGMADIMRGSAQTATTATTDAIKARFQSVRSQRKQDEFADFASRVMQIKAEIISVHFDEANIIRYSNVEKTTDAQFAQAAVKVIKNEIYHYRIEVKPEQISMTDHAALKQERLEAVQMMAGLFQILAPMAQVLPGMTPLMLEVAQWGFATCKGASQIEGVFDQAIQQTTQQAQQPKPPPPPDPKVVAAQMKAQGDMMKIKGDIAHEQVKQQADLTVIAAETKAEVAKQQAQMVFNVQEEAQKAQIKRQAAMDPGALPLPGGR